jgi:hypothetical protein
VAGPQATDELARRCEAHEESLFRIMRALAAVGIFTQTPPPIRFGLNSLSNWLRSDVPNSLDLHMIAYFGAAHERTRDEFQCLLEESGFSLKRVIGTTASIAVIEAIA